MNPDSFLNFKIFFYLIKLAVNIVSLTRPSPLETMTAVLVTKYVLG